MERMLIPIINSPTAATCGNSCAPAIRAVMYPLTTAAATVHITLSIRKFPGAEFVRIPVNVDII